MKKKLILHFFTLFVLLFCTQNLKANHAMAVDLSYTCISNLKYEVTLAFYFDCGSTILETPPANPNISITSAACMQALNIDLQMVTGTGKEVSQVCLDSLQAGSTNCGVGTLPGVKQYLYKGVVELPAACPDWKFAYLLGGTGTRSATLTNLDNPSFYKIYVEATLNNTNQICNSSPTFNTIPVAYFCKKANTYYHATTEPDGDSLVFQLVTPLAAANTPVPYSNINYSATNPFASSYFNFNTQNGNLEFKPSGVQFAAVAVLVQEYRNGVLIGSVMRDMQFLILDCNNEPINTATQPTTNFFSMCYNETLSLDFQFNDLNVSDSVHIFTQLFEPNQTLPTFPFTNLTAQPNPYFYSFTFTPQSNTHPAGIYTLLVYATDNACPLSSHFLQTYLIEVKGVPSINPQNIIFCDTQNPLQASVQGGNQFTWNPIQNITFLNNSGSLVEIDLKNAQIGENISYSVANECNEINTLNISILDTFALNVTPIDPTICQGGGVQLQAQTDNNDNYIFEWTPALNINNPNVANPYINPLNTTTYTVKVINKITGCTRYKNITVQVSAASAEVKTTANETTICKNENTVLHAELDFNIQLNCGINNTPCNTADTVSQFVGYATTNTYEVTPYNAFWANQRMQILYPASELQAGNLESGTIQKIGFCVAKKYSTLPYSNFTIKMGCTTLTELTNFVPGLATVYTTPQYSTTETPAPCEPNIHVLQNPYDWDGVSNIIVEVCYSNPNDDIFDAVDYTQTDYNSVIYDVSSVTEGCLLDQATASKKRPTLIVGLCRPQPPISPTITWTPAEGLNNPHVANPLATPSKTTTYTVTFDDAGCIGSGSVTIHVVGTDSIFIKKDTTICSPQNVQLYAYGKIPNTATYQWTPATNLNNANIPNPIATVNQTTTYTLTINFNDNCNTVITQPVTLTLGSVPNNISLTPQSADICAGDSVVLQANGGSVYKWLNSNGLSCNNCPNPTATPTTNTTYNVVIADENGCGDTLQVPITILPAPTLTISPLQTQIHKGQTVQLNATGSFETITWTPANNLSNAQSPTPTVIGLEQSTTYIATAQNANGCSTQQNTQIIYVGCNKVVIPTAFSPNNDGTNDFLKPLSSTFEKLLTFKIYDRWGNLVFETTNATQGWDGTNRKGETCPIGLYALHISVLCENEPLQYKGSVMLVR